MLGCAPDGSRPVLRCDRCGEVTDELRRVGRDRMDRVVDARMARWLCARCAAALAKRRGTGR